MPASSFQEKERLGDQPIMTLSLSAGEMPTPEFRPSAILKPESFKPGNGSCPFGARLYPGSLLRLSSGNKHVLFYTRHNSGQVGPANMKRGTGFPAPLTVVSCADFPNALPLQPFHEDPGNANRRDNAADPDPGRHPAKRILAFVRRLVLRPIEPNPADKKGDENAAERQKYVG